MSLSLGLSLSVVKLPSISKLSKRPLDCIALTNSISFANKRGRWSLC
jgi:hypothetical protein